MIPRFPAPRARAHTHAHSLTHTRTHTLAQTHAYTPAPRARRLDLPRRRNAAEPGERVSDRCLNAPRCREPDGPVGRTGGGSAERGEWGARNRGQLRDTLAAGSGSPLEAAAQVAQTQLAGIKVQMKAAPGRCRGRGRSQKESSPARCQIDPAESYTLPARKLSSPVIWETWRQRGRGSSLRPVPPSWLHYRLRREPACGRGRPAGGWGQVLPPGRG